MPLPALLILLDWLLAGMLHYAIDRLLPVPDVVWRGAAPRTQVLDCVHAMDLIISKSLDLHSAGAIVAADIKRYYDSIDMIRIAAWLRRRGEAALAKALLLLYLAPRVHCSVGGVSFDIVRRTMGVITGVRSSVAIGRIPVPDVCTHRAPQWRKWGWGVGEAGAEGFLLHVLCRQLMVLRP